LSALLLCLNSIVSSQAESPPVEVNRTVSQAEPPRPEFQFSARPTPQEFFRAHIFAEPLVPVGGEPTAADNADLAAALSGYAHRNGPDDFSSLTDFLAQHPESPWKAALLTDLGYEYYNTAHYSLAIDAWSNAWSLAGQARDARAAALVQRAFGELLRMDSRLGRMDELERLLNSIGNQPPAGPAGQRVVDAREALWSMKNRPQIAFRCGPLALRSIRIALGLPGSSDAEIFKSASTQRGCSLPQVAELSRKIGLNYQMAFRNLGDFVVPSVVHWKVGHYAALVRKAGELYELDDPTFGNKTWATRQALEAETSGYFLVAAGALPAGWRAVNEAEGATIWGKGQTAGNDPQHICRNDLAAGGSCPAQNTGMATAKVHLMDVNLHLSDNPVGYSPPVGPKVKFVLDYNLRDLFQPANINYGNLGPQWTSAWSTYITDNPMNPLADVNLYVAEGGQRTYTGFDTNTQSFAYQQYDQNLLTRTSTNPITYQLLYGDGSKMIFGQSDGSNSSSRNIFLTQEIDPQGNALTFSYNSNLCLVSVQDAIGQVTTLTYGLAATNIGSGVSGSTLPADPYKLTSVTDPFGRTATFNYEPQVVEIVYTYVNGILSYTNYVYTWALASDTDVIGITSQFGYQALTNSVTTDGGVVFVTYINLVNSLTTSYGTTSFAGVDNGNTRTMDISYPDGSRERIQYYQAYVYDTNVAKFQSDSPLTVPTGMTTFNNYLLERDSYYWDRNASALALGDYSKARQFHFCHTESGTLTSGCVESMKPPLEGRIWFDYAGQNGGSQIIGSNTLPLHVGRVLDDGATQLYSYAYNPFGHNTNSIDPVGRTLTFIYDTNGIDLLEVRQTRSENNELLAKMTYNSQHLPLTLTDAAGQTTTCAYNARGQMLSITDAKLETTKYNYDTNGYLLSIDGPLPGTNDTIKLTYDAFGRVQTLTDVSGYTVTNAYDNLDRVTRLTHPDGTFAQFTYDRLDCAAFQDRAGRQTLFEYDNLRQLTTVTDAVLRVTHFNWCRCGALGSLIDPMGRKTSWLRDVQGRTVGKQYADGSQASFSYEGTTSRLQLVTDERQQAAFCTYNLDDTIKSLTYGNSAVPTPNVSFSYDPDYLRVASMTDGVGTTTWNYIPIASPPVLGAGRLGTTVGPLTNSSITYGYDELGRVVQTSVDGDFSTRIFDAAGRTTSISNALGTFTNTYDGASSRLLSKTYPNGQTAAATYGSNLQDFALQQLTYAVGATPVSKFTYGYDTTRMQLTNWAQQAGAQAPSVSILGYDAVNQLLSALVTNSGALANSFGYSYDFAGNRLTETIAGSTATATYNSLNQLGTTDDPAAVSRTNQWDAQNRLVAVTVGNQTTQFGYDGSSRLNYIRKLRNGTQVSLRYFGWFNNRVWEERDASGINITKRFYPQGVVVETGTNAGAYYYTRDHLGSIREMTDAAGNVRARYSYDPFGRRTKLAGNVDADFGFAGMFWAAEASLAMARYRAYDPELGRWLSRDPLKNAEIREGPNLYAYTGNEPVGKRDPSGFGFDTYSANPAVALAIATGGTVTAVVEEAGGPEAVEQDFIQGAETCATIAQAGVDLAQEGGDEFTEEVTTIFQRGADTVVDLVSPFAETAEAYLPEISEIPQKLSPWLEMARQATTYNQFMISMWNAFGDQMTKQEWWSFVDFLIYSGNFYR
jgi:RHS repeat-associated protein